MQHHNLAASLLITGDPATDPAQYLKKLTVALKNGSRLVQIRAKFIKQNDYALLAKAAVELCHQYAAKALLSKYVELITKIPADGIHVPSADLMTLTARPVAKHLLFSASCHDVIQLQHAITVDADFVLISPVFTTPSCPAGQALGWKNFAALTKLATMPAYALGGVTPQDLSLARAHGAFGIAAIRALWEQNTEKTH